MSGVSLAESPKHDGGLAYAIFENRHATDDAVLGQRGMFDAGCQIVDPAFYPADCRPTDWSVLRPGKDTELQACTFDQLLELVLLRNREIAWDAQGNGLLDAAPIPMEGHTKSGASIVFDLVRRRELGFNDHWQAVRVANNYIGALAGALAEHAGLLDLDTIRPTRVLGPQSIAQFDVEGRLRDAPRCSSRGIAPSYADLSSLVVSERERHLLVQLREGARKIALKPRRA